MNSTSKGLCLLLSPKGKKNTTKISIDTKALAPSAKVSQPQSTKNSAKPSAGSIPTYRLMQYVFFFVSILLIPRIAKTSKHIKKYIWRQEIRAQRQA